MSKTGDKPIASVYSTTDYEKFKTLDGNRSVKSGRIKRILESIDKVGYRLSPIIVNKRFEVIDGQGRLAALTERNLPVYYVIDATAGIDECRSLNIGMTNWGKLDWIESFAADGNEEYATLLTIVREYTDLGIDLVLVVCSGSYTNHQSDIITEGRFVMKRRKEVCLDWLERFRTTKAALKAFGGTPRQLFGAMMFAVEQCKADKTRVFDKVNGIPRGSIAGLPADTIGSCRLLEELYNNRLGRDSRIYFAAEWDKWNRAKTREDDKA